METGYFLGWMGILAGAVAEKKVRNISETLKIMDTNQSHSQTNNKNNEPILVPTVPFTGTFIVPTAK